jgi:carbon-monoxide dehydrogenase iron sulfur subunit
MRKIFVDSVKCLGCHSCELYCAVAHSRSGNLYGAIAESPVPLARVSVEKSRAGCFPLQCRHCDDAQCLKACVTKALYRDAVSGAVLQKDELCIGCSMCAIACPFGSIEDNPENKTISKCDLCLTRKENPVCVTACPTGALSFEDSVSYSKEKRKAYLVELDTKSGGESRYE